MKEFVNCATNVIKLKKHVELESIHKGVHYSFIQCDHEAKSIHMGANFACSHCDYKATQKENLKVLVGTFMNYFVTHEDNLIIKQLKPY